jgi:hypothetical protein
MGERLADGNLGVALLANTGAMDAPGFIAAELAGGLLGAGLVRLFVIRKAPA